MDESRRNPNDLVNRLSREDDHRRPNEAEGTVPGGASHTVPGASDAAYGGASGAVSGRTPDSAGGAGSRPAYYYSYGPFRSGGMERESAGAEPASAGTPGSGNEPSPSVIDAEVSMSPARPAVRTSAAPIRTWHVHERKRTSLLSLAIAFIAGVVLVGGLMVASDRLNWFTDADEALVQKQGTDDADDGVLTTASSSSGSGAVSNAIDTVRPNNIAKIFEQSSPAVVKIETYVKQRSRSSGSLFDDPFFRQFFGDSYRIPSDRGGSEELLPSGLGSGFFFDEDGYILTNQHVVGNADKIKVTVLGYEEPFEAEMLGSSYELDLAVLKIKGDKPFPTLKLGDSDAIRVGEWVVAIGNPNGFDHTVTVGVLSAKERPIEIEDRQGTRRYKHLLQTDASINPGNSGGPLINLSGEVIGINTAVSTTAQGIGFAIPTSTIVEVLDTLKANEKVPQPFIGATLADITEQAASQLGLDNTKGSIVVNILYNSPAYKADLRQYDVIVGMDGKKYDKKEDLIEAIQKKKTGDNVTLEVIRGGRTIEITVEIGDKNDFNVQ